MSVDRTRPRGVAPLLRVLALGALVLLLDSCGGKNKLSPPGTPVLTMSASHSSEFAGYMINVSYITLTRTDGYVVYVLRTPQTVDLAHLADMPELVAAPAVPSGTYKSATVTLDYTYAQIFGNINGAPVLLTPVNNKGSSVTSINFPVTFDPANQLSIARGQSSRLDVHFDLSAFNSINASTSKVTVQPFVTLRPAPVDGTVMRARGLYVNSAPAGATGYIINTRPFVDQVSMLGSLQVATSGTTYFNVDDNAYTGSAGLGALASQVGNQTYYPVAAYGTLGDLSGITPTFNATSVYGGSSLESTIADSVSGIVTARSGAGVITVHGATFRPRPLLISTVGDIFRSDINVTLGPNTVVSQDDTQVAGLNTNAISVGQRVTVSGQASSSGSGTSVTISLDATAGHVRLASTPIWGTLTSGTLGSATLNVSAFDIYAPSSFNFAGTGTTAAQNANPAAYALNTGAINAGALTQQSLLRADGLVTPFAAAPPDFNASALTEASSTPQKLVVEWTSGATAPFTSIGSAGIVVNLTGSNSSYVATGPTIAPLTGSLTVTTTGAGTSDLVLAVGSASPSSGMSMYATAGSFAAGVSSALNGSNKVYRLVAVGTYDSATSTFVASQVSVALLES